MGFPDSSAVKESACNAGHPSLLPMLGEVMPEEFQNYAGFITDLGPIIQEGKTAELGLVLTQRNITE